MTSNLVKPVKKIVILEDSPGCTFVYGDIFNNIYRTTFYDSFNKWSEFVKNGEFEKDLPDILIIDLMLTDGPFKNNLHHQLWLKIVEKGIPFIIISSCDHLDSIRFFLQNGAADYIVKPFKKNEILAKVEKALSQQEIGQAPFKTNLLLALDEEHFGDLTKKEFCILDLFLTSPGNVVTKTQLMDKIWGMINVNPKTVEIHISHLRKKLLSKGIRVLYLGKNQWQLIYADSNFSFSKV